MTVRKVGTCEIVRELGRGGMGVVYEALQPDLERRVAVKELPAELAKSRELAERFKREGRAYAQLRHQSIVTVHDLVEKLDALYLITEYVDGADLAKLLEKGGPLPPACVAVIGARVAKALDYVHFNKLLHRDVKPANVMISREGEVKLMDFGIAKDQTVTDLTREGMVVGSPSYLAPEVVGGGDADPRSDIWALGVTLYELCTAQKPIKGKSADALFAAIRKGRYIPVRTLEPQVPRRLATAIQRCLEKRPKARWENAAKLGRELEICAGRYLDGFHPQGRLVALMTHRGFADEKDALAHMDAAALAATHQLDEGKSVDLSISFTEDRTPAPRRGWRWVVGGLAVAAAGGAAAWLHWGARLAAMLSP